MSTPGNFNFMSHDEAAMMSDMYQAITKTNSWEWIKTAVMTAENVSKSQELNVILGAMKHPEVHSGFSLIHNLSAMQYLAQAGWDAYVENNTNLTFVKKLFQVSQGVNHDDICPHGQPIYSCMPCSH